MTTDTDKLDFKKILPVFVIVLVDLLGLTVIIPLLPLYATSFGADALTIGLLGAAYPLMQFVGAPLLGRFSDRYGRKPILLLSQVGTLIGFVVLGLANSLWLLFLSRLIDGLSGANISTAQAVIADRTTEKTRTQGLGLIGAAFGLGFVLGPVIAFLALALSGNDYHVPAWIAAGCSLISILLTWFWLEESLPAEQRGPGAPRKAPISLAAMLQAVSHPQVGLLMVLMFSQQLVFGGFEYLLSLFTLSRLGLNASGNSIIFVFVGVIVVAVQGGLVGQWSRRLGDRRLVYLGLAALAVGMVLTSVTPAQPVPWYSRAALEQELQAEGEVGARESATARNIPVALPDDANTGWLGLVWILAAMVPASIGGGVLQPALNSLITKRVEPAEVGGMLGLSAAFYSGANALAPLITGGIFQALGSTAPFLSGGLLLGGLLLAAWRLIRPGREAETTAGLARR